MLNNLYLLSCLIIRLKRRRNNSLMQYKISIIRIVISSTIHRRLQTSIAVLNQ